MDIFPFKVVKIIKFFESPAGVFLRRCVRNTNKNLEKTKPVVGVYFH
jgi:hypothetical protein